MEVTEKRKNRLSQADLSLKEQDAVVRVLSSGYAGPNGPEVRAFEEELKDWFGSDHQVLTTSSGTAALHLALIALGVTEGDLVLIQDYSFAAPAFATSYVKATPIFVGSEPEGWNMEPNALEAALKDLDARGLISRVKAIIPVHVYGNPADMSAISMLASSYGIPILEDAAEAMGSSYQGVNAGLLGDVGVISFNANKVLTTLGGGALISRNHELVLQARYLANQAKVPGGVYRHATIGYNYNMNSVAAAIGRVQLKRLPELLHNRSNINRAYKEGLGQEVQFQQSISDAQSNNWITTIETQYSSELLKAAQEQNVELRSSFFPMHLQEAFKGSKFYGSSSVNAIQNRVCLPSGHQVDSNEVISLIARVLKQY